MNRTTNSLALLLALVLALAACGNGDPDTAEPDTGADPTSADDDHGEGPDQDEVPEGDADTHAGEGLVVVAPVYPLAWVAEQIAPAADVHLLTDAGDDPHDVELTPRGRELLETADIVLYMGDIGYQPQVEAAVPANPGVVVSFADEVGRDRLLDWDGHDHDDHAQHDDSDDHGHEDHEDLDQHDGHSDDHGNYDPHAWFDATAMAAMTEAAGEAFASTDADRADDFRARAAELADDFRALDEEIGELYAAGCRHDVAVVSHEAYAYLLEPHGFSQEGVSGTGGHGAASPARIGELVTLVREEGIDYVLAEPLEGRRDALAVADEAGVDVLDIYSLEVVDDEGLFTERGFLTLLRDQAETMATALACG